jgi:hypothetical protein
MMSKIYLSLHRLAWTDKNGCPRCSFYESKEQMHAGVNLLKADGVVRSIDDSLNFEIRSNKELCSILNLMEESLV